MKRNNVKILINQLDNFNYSCQIIPKSLVWEIKKTGGRRIVELLGQDIYSNDLKIVLNYLSAGPIFKGNFHTDCGQLLESAIARTFSKNFETFNYDPNKNELAGDAFIDDPDFNGLPDFFCKDKLVIGEIKTAGINKKTMNYKNGGYTKYISKSYSGFETELVAPKAYLIQLFLMFDMAIKHFKTPPKSCILITAFIKDKEKIVSILQNEPDLVKREKLADELLRECEFHFQSFTELPKNWEEIKKTALAKRDELLTHKKNVFNNSMFNVSIPINEKTINYINELKSAEHIELIINKKRKDI